MRTGSVFRAISNYIAAHLDSVEMFQWETVVALMSKATAKNDCGEKVEIGPSNLSAVCAILRNEAKLFSHTYQVCARDFGSGAQLA